HIVQIYEVGEQNGRPFFSMEFISGGSLDRQIAGTPQPARAAAQLVEALARTIHHAHEHGIIHRDLKPANILLASVVRSPSSVATDGGEPATDYGPRTTDYGLPKITDFGLAKLLWADEAGPTQSGDLLGTPSYMAPEQIEAKSDMIGPAADVYGLGSILYELLTGRPPFKTETAMETLLQVRFMEPVSPSRFQPKLARDLVTICLHCLHKEPHKRYASALALAEDLRRFLADRPIQARRTSRAERVLRWCRRNPVVAGLSAALAVLLVVLGVGFVVTSLVRQERDKALVSQTRAERAERKVKLLS